MKKLILFLTFTLYLVADATIFVYHRFGDTRFPSTNTPLHELKAEFEYFKDNGYEVIPLKKLVKALKDDQEIQDNWVVLTIDDSYKSFYQNGLPLFKKYNYPFTLFVQSETALWKTSKEYMDKNEIIQAAKYGEIGCHSHKHDYLPTKTIEYIKNDTQKCVEIMSNILGYKPKYYAYPYGSYNVDVKKAVQDFGFEAIVNQTNGSVTSKSDRFDLYRVALVGEVDNFKSKFNWKFLHASWEPIYYPNDGVLKDITVNFHDEVKMVQIYVSGHRWSDWIKVKNDKLFKELNYKLEKDIVRVFIKDTNNRFSSKILTKGDIHAK